MFKFQMKSIVYLLKKGIMHCLRFGKQDLTLYLSH